MMNSNPKQRTEERGVALLLTLGVLSLLLILTMSFAFTARTELLASEVNADMIKARLLCESGLERVLGFLSFSFDGTEPEDVFPATSGELFTSTNAASGDPGSDAAWSGRSYMYSTRGTPDQNGIESALATDIGFSFIPQRTNAEITDGDELPDVSWQHMEDDNGELIGRIAFIVVDESGKLDPESLVTFEEPYSDDNGNGAHDAGEYYADLDNNGAYTSAVIDEANTSRVGWSPQEVNLDNAIPAAVTITGNGNGFRTGMNANAQTWFSWQHMQPGVPDMSASEAVDCLHVMFPQSHDIEAWDDGTIDKHRFDLYGANWTTMTLATLQAPATDFSAANTGGIPWIAQMEDSSTPPNSVSDQVAANLIDYCDSDSLPTVSPANPITAGSLDYCGLEEVPYLNEIIITAAWGDGSGDFKITVDAELANLYADYANPSGLALDIKLDFADADLDGIPPDDLTEHTFNLVCGTDPIPANAYLSTSDGNFDNDDKDWPLSSDFTFNIEKIIAVLKDSSGNILDASVIEVNETGRSISAAPGSAQEVKTSVEGKDPRGNSLGSGWEWASADPFTSPDPGTQNAVNTAWAPTPGTDDPETVTNPVDGLSTAYIRNAPMEGLWELGAIHRGEPWRTINLKAYNDGSDLATTPGTYENGDGRILDQVKIGSQTEVYGRVNVNSPVQAVWEAVLTGINYTTSYHDPIGEFYIDVNGNGNNDAGEPYIDVNGDSSWSPTSETVINVSGSGGMAEDVVNTNGPSGVGPFAGRGGICEVSMLKDGTGFASQDTDREQEEIIGKVAHLLTARQNYFNVIVVAQALQDIGGNTSNRSILVTKSDGSDTNVNILAEQKIKAVVYRDAFRNEFEVKRYEFLED